MVLPSLVFLSVLTLPALLLGKVLGKPMGLGLVNARSDDNAPSTGLYFALLTAIPLGAFLIGLRWMLLPYLPDEIPAYGFRGVTGGLLVSLGAVIGEEIWFRFGLMTVLLWFMSKWVTTPDISDRAALVVILFVAVCFGVAHLPQLASFGAASSFAIWATIGGNVCVATLYGWCYWRYGLLSAILAHFTLDIVLHVLTAL